MKKYILSAAVGLISLAFTASARAHHGGAVRAGYGYAGFGRTGYGVSTYTGPVVRSTFVGSPRVSRHGTVFAGRTTLSYSSRRWLPAYGCYGYYYPVTATWYYWYPSLSCYLPFSYFDEYPVVVAP